MIGKNFYFDGKKIPWSATEGKTAGWYAEIDVMNVSSEAEEKSRQGNHGVKAYPTFARGRVVKVSGIIFGTKEERGERRKKVEEIFRLPFSPKNGEEFKELRFEDDDGVEWKLKAKMLSLPQFTHDLAEYTISFSFSLLAENPVMYSTAEKTITGNYGRILGVSLPVSLPTAFSGTIGEVSGENEGNFPSPVKITISGEILNPKITNLSTGDFWRVEENISAPDILVIDTFSQAVKKNGVDVLASRSAGSNWLHHYAGTNFFLLSGDDFSLDDTEKANFSLSFFDARL